MRDVMQESAAAEPEWTIPMCLAWIRWRDDGMVTEVMRLGEGSQGGEAVAYYRSQAEPEWIWPHSPPDVCPPAAALPALVSALKAGIIVAEGVNPAGVCKPIKRRDWRLLRIEFDGVSGRSLRLTDGERRNYQLTTIPQADVRMMWPAESSPAALSASAGSEAGRKRTGQKAVSDWYGPYHEEALARLGRVPTETEDILAAKAHFKETYRRNLLREARKLKPGTEKKGPRLPADK